MVRLFIILYIRQTFNGTKSIHQSDHGSSDKSCTREAWTKNEKDGLGFVFFSSVNIPPEWKAVVVVAAAVSRAVGSDLRWTLFVVAGAAAVVACCGGRPREVVVPR